MLVLGRCLGSATKDVNKNGTNINKAQTSRAPPGVRHKEVIICGGSSISCARRAAPAVSRSRSSIRQLRRRPGRAAGARAAGARSPHSRLVTVVATSGGHVINPRPAGPLDFPPPAGGGGGV